jgi:hypothetical protein
MNLLEADDNMVSVGGMAADLGLYQSQVTQFRAMLDAAGVNYKGFMKPDSAVDWAPDVKYLFEIFSNNDPWYSRVAFNEAGNMVWFKHCPYD